MTRFPLWHEPKIKLGKPRSLLSSTMDPSRFPPVLLVVNVLYSTVCLLSRLKSFAMGFLPSQNFLSSANVKRALRWLTGDLIRILVFGGANYLSQTLATEASSSPHRRVEYSLFPFGLGTRACMLVGPDGEALRSVTSPPVPMLRGTFVPFERGLGLTHSPKNLTSASFPLESVDAIENRSVLAKYLAGTQSTDQVYAVARRRFREVLARWANEEQPVHALRHISDALFGTFSEVVLGAPVVPDGFVEAVDALEKVIVEETPPFEWLGAWTPSQRRFDKARKTYARLARELIYINRQHILANPPNYPSDLCQEIVGKLGGQRSDYIMHDHVVKGACGLFLAMGNPNHLLGATLYMLTAKPDLIPLKTLALAAEPRWREHMRSGPLRNIYYEMLRYISPANLLTRWSAKGLDLGDGKDPVPSNCLVGICVRDVLHHPDLWKDPSTFNPHRFDRSSGGDAANRFLHIYPMIPFSIGERKCPGPQSAEAIFAAFCAEWTEGGYVFEPVGPLTLHERAPVTRLDATHRGRIRRQF